MDANKATCAANSEANQVKNFLLSIGVAQEVAQKFEDEKMTHDAILKASDEQIRNDLGLSRLGDRLSLRSFCENHHGKSNASSSSDIESRKKQLIEELAKKRVKKQNNVQLAQKKMNTTGNTKSTRRVEVVWLHCTKGSKTFKVVRMNEGGGTRLLNILKSANKEEITKSAEDLFFPNGKSTLGYLREMDVDLLNFKKEKVSTILVGDEHVPFTLGLYIDTFKLSKVRLYLSTKQNDSDDSDSDISVNDDAILEHSVFDDLSPEQENVPCSSTFISNTNDSLIGTSKEREELKNLIDKAYQESLMADQAKSLETMMQDAPNPVSNVVHDQVNNSIDELRKIRADRLPEEPNVADPHYIVSVRHLSLGVVTRLFSQKDWMFCVYDWIGSLDKSPKYFQLCKYSGGCISPEESVKCADKSMLAMLECEYPVVFSPDGELIPKGFGPLVSSSFSDHAITIDSILEECPTAIMVDDESDLEGNGENTMESHSSERNKTNLRYKREKAAEVLETAPTITVERDNIVSELLDLYKSNSLSMNFINFIIKDELAQDMDGVKREIYTIFWDGITSRYFEGGKSFVPRVGPDVTDDLCKILGRALIHSFLITGIWPIQLSKLFSIAVTVGEESLNDEDFLDAFLEYVLDYEAVILQKALTEAENGMMTANTQQQVLEVLSPFGLRSLPTNANIKSLLVNTAKCELVQKVNRSINKFREGLQDMDTQILVNVEKEDVLQLYNELCPTPTKVLSLMKADVDGVLTKSQEEVYRHLRRYVNAADAATLKRFMRFVTGSNFLVAKEIKVIFHLSIGRLPCLVAHTCGCTVDLPVGSYMGFVDFKTQLDSILCNPESWKFHLV